MLRSGCREAAGPPGPALSRAEPHQSPPKAKMSRGGDLQPGNITHGAPKLLPTPVSKPPAADLGICHTARGIPGATRDPTTVSGWREPSAYTD